MYDQRKLGSNLLSYGQIELLYLTSQNNRCTQGGVRLYITNNTSHNITSQNTTSHNNTSNNNTSREVVAMTKGGDEGKWWRREVVTWGSDDSGKWWPREVVTTKGSGELVKWWLWAVVIVAAAWMLHGIPVGEEAGERNHVLIRVKWLQPAMKGTSCVRRVRLRSFHRRIGSSSAFCNEWLFVCA